MSQITDIEYGVRVSLAESHQRGTGRRTGSYRETSRTWFVTTYFEDGEPDGTEDFDTVEQRDAYMARWPNTATTCVRELILSK